MTKALMIRNEQKVAAAAAAMARMLACTLFVGILMGLQAYAGSDPRAGHSATAVTVDSGGTAKFPPNPYLRRTTVSLRMVGYVFGSGVRFDNRGKPTGNGVEIVQRQWCGSGFVIGKDGTVVTNYHVAQRALRGEVIFDDGRRYDVAHLKVYDPENDLAVLKINSSDTFATAQLGDLSVAEVRDSVLAAGNGLCEGLSITEGNISMLKRDERSNIAQVVHTASILPGNSGGPLYRGDRVIGINVQGIEGYQRYYAVPVSKLRRLLDKKYETSTYLQDVFPPDPRLIAEKTHRLSGTFGQVGAASHKGPGLWSTQASLASLRDYAILVKTASKKNLDIVILGGNAEPIGLGTSSSLDTELVFLSSERILSCPDLVHT